MDRVSVFPQPLGAAASWIRSQIAALIATAVDFVVLVALVETAGVFYVTATCIGAIWGGVVSFLINRNWSFTAETGQISMQAFRYLLVWFGSIALNTYFVFTLTEHAGINYQGSKVLTAIAIGLFFNFPLHRYFCFSESLKND